MARPRKPLEMQRGHLKIIDYQQKEMEEAAVMVDADQLQKPPTWLIDATAKREWKRLVRELEKINIVGNLDLNNLGAYCNAYANYRKATQQLKGEPLTVEKLTQFGIQMVPNPLIAIQTKYSDEMRRYASLCGLTIDSRLKAGSAKVEKQEDAIAKRFGI
jgi:P27 family predicted phage terminase small subunit